MTKLSSFWVTSKRTSRILSAAAHAAVLKPHTAWPQFNSSPTTRSSASNHTRACPSHSDLSTSTVTHLIKNCTQKCSKGLRISGICRQCPSGGKSKSFHSPLGVYWDRPSASCEIWPGKGRNWTQDFNKVGTHSGCRKHRSPSSSVTLIPCKRKQKSLVTLQLDIYSVSSNNSYCGFLNFFSRNPSSVFFTKTPHFQW